MTSIRQNKVSELIKRELSHYFQQNSRTVCQGAMVSVTVLRISKDLSLAKAYLSIFGVGADKNEVFKNINEHKPAIRMHLAQQMKNQMRKVPELAFYLDDSLDYSENINELLS